MSPLLHRAAAVAVLAIWSLAGAQASGTQTLPAVRVPVTAPAFELQGEDGETYRLADFRGRVVVLNFWATWCSPCREEMPSMERAWQKVEDQGIAFLGVNVGEGADTIFEFTGRYPVSFPLLMDSDGEVVKRYPVSGLPTTYIIGPDGQVVRRVVGSREWDDPMLLDLLRGIWRTGH